MNNNQNGICGWYYCFDEEWYFMESCPFGVSCSTHIPSKLVFVTVLSSGADIEHQGETQALSSKYYNKVSRDAKQSHSLFRDRKSRGIKEQWHTGWSTRFRSRIDRYSQLNIRNIRFEVRIHKWQMRTKCICLCDLDYLIEHNFSHFCPYTWKLHFFSLQLNEGGGVTVISCIPSDEVTKLQR